MADMVLDLLGASGPCLSTDLSNLLIKKGLTPTAARQRVARANVKRLRLLPFPKKAVFVCHPDQYRSAPYWDALNTALIEKSPSYGPALAALVQRDGLVPRAHFSIACGAPIRQKKQLSADTILDRLIATGVVEEVLVPGVGRCIATANVAKNPDAAIPHLKARLIVEDIILRAVQTWTRNLALASYNKVAIRDAATIPQVGTFAWDLTAPSYLGALAELTPNRVKPGFIACDVLLGRTITAEGIAPYLKKCSTLRTLKRLGRCLQIFVADGYTEDAYGSARSSGVVPATPETLFGKAVADALTQLARILEDAATTSVNPEEFSALFNQLSAIEGAALNLRGALFELLIAELVRQLEPGNVSVNRLFKDAEGTRYEVDVLIDLPRKQVAFIECKGYGPNQAVSLDEIQHWLDVKIRFLRRYASEDREWEHIDHIFEFWTSGVFSPEAHELLERTARTVKKYRVRYKNGSDIRSYAKSLKGSPLLKTLDEHFFRHPLTTRSRG